MKIYKYEIEETNFFPVGAQFISAIMQYGKIVVYAIVDPDAELEYRRIHSIGTGWDMDESFFEGKQFLGTVKQDPYVWHIFIE